jgi:CRISPR/Cas system CSM-associated protein Csm3 (group 7 of RAMP superfamily)
MRIDRIHVSYELTFTTPFHCGTGLRVGLIDRTIIRDYNGYLYVPGSTIKGVVREHCERLALLYEDFDDMRELIASPHNGLVALWAITRPITMITRIFGSQHVPGQLFFDDAYQQNKEQYDSRGTEGKGKYKSLQADLYTQVRLDRLTRTAVPGGLYTSELGVKDITLTGNISGWLKCSEIETLASGPTYSLLLLLAGLQMVEQIGGNKSTGKGQCRCNVLKVMINGTSYEQWQTWLDHLDVLSLYSSVQQEEEA